MSNKALSKFKAQSSIPLDPEIAAIYENSDENRDMSGQPDKKPAASNRDGKAPPTPALLNEFEKLKHFAEENQRNGIDRKAYADGSFDQVEHDVSNVFKIGFKLLTSE